MSLQRNRATQRRRVCGEGSPTRRGARSSASWATPWATREVPPLKARSLAGPGRMRRQAGAGQSEVRVAPPVISAVLLRVILQSRAVSSSGRAGDF